MDNFPKDQRSVEQLWHSTERAISKTMIDIRAQLRANREMIKEMSNSIFHTVSVLQNANQNQAVDYVNKVHKKPLKKTQSRLDLHRSTSTNISKELSSHRKTGLRFCKTPNIEFKNTVETNGQHSEAYPGRVDIKDRLSFDFDDTCE